MARKKKLLSCRKCYGSGKIATGTSEGFCPGDKILQVRTCKSCKGKGRVKR